MGLTFVICGCSGDHPSMRLPHRAPHGVGTSHVKLDIYGMMDQQLNLEARAGCHHESCVERALAGRVPCAGRNIKNGRAASRTCVQ